ncbi:MAG: hypothetical protein JSV88_32495 [Candidatus Aminicenantes bacterium]|nr:MAG: hypothetical protein JSV88_32495 [Candidatus Aminicenantes bacterium]
MPELVIGTPPRGEDYFGQDHFIETIWSHLKKDNVLLVAPRRFGKTGAMYRLLDYPRKPYVPIYIDVEYIMSAADFMVDLIVKLIKKRHFRRLAKAIWAETKEFGRFIRNLPTGIDFGGLKVEIREKTDVQKRWLDYGDQIKSLLSKETSHLLLIIDEFPIMVDNIIRKNHEEAKQFLHWFRSLRTAPDTSARFVLGGSINLVSTLEYHGLVDTINDIPLIKLPIFSPETAKRFIEEIFSSRNTAITGEVKETILQLIGEPIPYLLAVLLTAIINRARVLNREVTPGIVKEAFDEDLLGGSTSAVFLHYRARIDQYQYYSDLEARTAKTILGILSLSDKPVKRDTLYQVFLETCNLSPGVQSREDFLRLMQKLDNDFYLKSKDNMYTFYSRVLKIWWKTHYGWGGTESAESTQSSEKIPEE